MRTPLVSVVVPTHERAHYAVSTIRSLLELSDEIEVVVSDSSENDAISPAFSGVQASARLKILRPTKKLSVVDNFNFALRSAVGRYVCFIGDDDFVSSELVTIAKWAERRCVDAIKLTFPALYFWPDFRHRTAGGEFAGTLRISPFTSRIMPHDARQAARDALDNLGAGPLEMPRIYAGLISSHLIKKITEKHGELFGGVSPDVYSALLISMEAEQCVKIDFPVVIPGASGASTAGLSAQGRHVGGLRDNPHISAFENLEWDPRIPEFYSVQTVWGFSILKAAEKLGLPLSTIGFGRLYFKCMVFQKGYLAEIWRAILSCVRRESDGVSALQIISGAVREFFWLVGEVIRRLRLRLRAQTEVSIQKGLIDSQAASRHLQAVSPKPDWQDEPRGAR
jgi:hypothetical protein